jgi:hypothetical protein
MGRKGPGLRHTSGWISYAAKADVRGGAVRSVRGACSDAIAIAVGCVAKKRASRHPLRLARRRPSRVVQHRAGGELGLKPVGVPFPYVPGDRVQPMTVRWKAVDRATLAVAVLSGVMVRKLALPDVAECLPSEMSSSPQGYGFCSRAPRAAYSDCASVGRVFDARAA